MIRSATPADVAAILDLIRELATYEREPASTVVTTEPDLTTALFREHPTVRALVAEDDAGAVVGTALWFETFSTWTGQHGMHLEDFVVTADQRGTGLGKALFDELKRICLERGYKRFEWRVLDWNTAVHGFYRAQGGAPLPEWDSWRITL